MQGEVESKETMVALSGLSPALCFSAVKLIIEEKYSLCLHNEGLCLRSASELSTILQIVSSLLKRFQTVTVDPESFPVNCLASSGLSCASSEHFLIEITMLRMESASLDTFTHLFIPIIHLSSSFQSLSL